MNADDNESPLIFPCRFPIKAMGKAIEDFDQLVLELVKQHAPNTCHEDVKKRVSRNGRYLSITITVEAHSRAQLDAIYETLTAHEQILMAL